MDFDGYWQENKRFVLRVMGAVVAFFAGIFTVDSLYAEDIAGATRSVRQRERELAQPMYDASDRDQARRENEALRNSLAELTELVAFETRPGLRLRPDGGSAANQYLRALSDVRERVLVAAGRAKVTIDPGLGMPKLSPTAEDEIERTLQALDAIELFASLAIEARVRRVEDIRVVGGPRSPRGRTAGPNAERTRVRLSVVGSSSALTALLLRTQRPALRGPALHGADADGRTLHLDEIEVLAARGRKGELRLDLELVLARFEAASLVDAASLNEEGRG